MFHHLRFKIIAISFLFLTACVGYEPLPYQQHYAPQMASPYGAVLPYGGYGAGGYRTGPGAIIEPGRELRNYGGYRAHEREHEYEHEHGHER